MTAGLNSKGRIWRFTTPTDDSVGGALPTGTVVYDNVYARISERRPTLALLEQGSETPSFYDVIFEPGSMTLQANDVYEDAYYSASRFYQKKFVILGPQYSSMQDNRKFISATLRRFDQAHAENLQ